MQSSGRLPIKTINDGSLSTRGMSGERGAIWSPVKNGERPTSKLLDALARSSERSLSRRGQAIAQGIWEPVPQGRLNLAQDVSPGYIFPMAYANPGLRPGPGVSTFFQGEAAPRSLAVLRF